MGRNPCCAKEGLNKGAWTATEDKILTDYIQIHGDGKWRNLPKKAGLKRCGKSCRLRWLNYLRPGIKRGNITSDEEDLIIRLHKLLGNRWSLIAGRLPGRTDNEIKNYWNTIIGKKLQNQQTINTSSTHNQSDQNGPNPNEENSKSMQKTAETSPTTVTSASGDDMTNSQQESIMEYNLEEDNYSSDLLVDFEIMDEQLIYDLLNADYSELNNFDNGGATRCDTSTYV